MDPIIIGIGAKVIETLVPYVKKGAQQFAKDFGIEVCNKAEGLLKTLKTRLSGDETTVDMLDGFEKDPEGFKPALEKIIQKKVEQDKELAAELNRTITEITNAGFFQQIGVVDEGGEAINIEADEMPQKNFRAEQVIGEVRGKATNARFKH